MKKLNQKGIGTLEIILIVVIAGLVVGVGWYVWNKNKSESKTTPTYTSTTKTSTPAKTSKPDDTENYLVIKEWGIKIKMRDAEKISIVVHNTSGSTTIGDYDAYAVPSFKPQYLQDKTCTPGVDLYRSLKLDGQTSPAKIGKYYYWVTGGPGACSNDPDHNPDDQLKQRFLKDFAAPENMVAI